MGFPLPHSSLPLYPPLSIPPPPASLLSSPLLSMLPPYFPSSLSPASLLSIPSPLYAPSLLSIPHASLSSRRPLLYSPRPRSPSSLALLLSMPPPALFSLPPSPSSLSPAPHPLLPWLSEGCRNRSQLQVTWLPAWTSVGLPRAACRLVASPAPGCGPLGRTAGLMVAGSQVASLAEVPTRLWM